MPKRLVLSSSGTSSFDSAHFTPGDPSGSDSKESTCNAGDMASVPGLGRSPGEGNGSPLQYSCLENSMDREAWQATVHKVAKSRTRLGNEPFHTMLSFPYGFTYDLLHAVDFLKIRKRWLWHLGLSLYSQGLSYCQVHGKYIANMDINTYSFHIWPLTCSWGRITTVLKSGHLSTRAFSLNGFPWFMWKVVP